MNQRNLFYMGLMILVAGFLAESFAITMDAGTWRACRMTGSDGTIDMSLGTGKNWFWTMGMDVKPSELSGQDVGLMWTRGAPLKFELVRDAGKILFEGTGGRRAKGTWTFERNPDFAAKVEKLGGHPADDRDLFRMTTRDIDSGFIEGLVEIGYTDMNADDVVRLSKHGIDLDYIKGVQGFDYKLDQVPKGGVEDVDRAVAAAERAWESWRWKTPKDRMELLLKLADVIDDNAEELARLESLNVGKPWWVAVDEPGVMSDNLRFFAGAARTLEGKAAAEYAEGYTSMIRREPLGLVAGIAPWNYPLFMVIWKLGPALAAGNVQIIKPAEQTPLTVLRFVELAQEFLPPGVLQVVTGEGVPAGDRLVRHPSIRLVSLTGDTATGKLIAKNAADTVKRVHLELGGKAPMVVLDDADPATVAEAIKVGGYFNSGQDCTASSRILVSERIYDDVLSSTVTAVEGMSVGDPGSDDEIGMGPVISAEQQERVLGFLERAVDAKATVVTGGASVGERGFFVSPTIVTDVEQSSEIVQNEVFGPVVTVQRFASDEEAVAMANDVRYGLAASVFSESVGRALKVAARLDFGTVWVNEHLFPLTPEMPHGGFNESGYGKDMSLYSMEEYTRLKHVCVKLA